MELCRVERYLYEQVVINQTRAIMWLRLKEARERTYGKTYKGQLLMMITLLGGVYSVLD